MHFTWQTLVNHTHVIYIKCKCARYICFAIHLDALQIYDTFNTGILCLSIYSGTILLGEQHISCVIAILCNLHVVHMSKTHYSRPFLCPRHSKTGGGALSVTPVRASVRPSVIKIWCLLNNFWKTASIQFKFGMLIYTGRVWFGLQSTNFWQSYGPFIKT